MSYELRKDVVPRVSDFWVPFDSAAMAEGVNGAKVAPGNTGGGGVSLLTSCNGSLLNSSMWTIGRESSASSSRIASDCLRCPHNHCESHMRYGDGLGH